MEIKSSKPVVRTWLWFILVLVVGGAIGFCVSLTLIKDQSVSNTPIIQSAPIAQPKILTSASPSSDTATGWQIFNSPTYHYSISYPLNWVADKDMGVVPEYGFSIHNPDGSQYISITIPNTNLSPEQLFEANKNHTSGNTESFSSVLSEGSISINGLKGYGGIVGFTAANGTSQVKEYYLPYSFKYKGVLMIDVTGFSATTSDLINSILSTFQFTK